MITDQIINGLFYLLAALTFVQPNAGRMYAGFVFITMTLVHDIFLSDLYGTLYYFSAGACDLLIMILIAGIRPIPKMVLKLHMLCIISCLSNLFGWAIWFSFYPPFLYNVLFVFIYLYALYVFIKRDSSDVGDFTLDSWISCFRFYFSPRVFYFNKHKGKI